MFDAMMLKREMGTNCNIDIRILETLKDGIVLRIMENTIDGTSLEFIIDFVRQHELNLLLEDGVFFISEQILAPSEPEYLSE
jgi:hypothetical protein